ncbi:MAG TPA: cupredoxin domain-containing protein [Candidatus Baltobacteraceae bacterium]|nr:cupredoxin domain-containing protein [Candidatus Baltobacteraceae bacterium]
MSTSLSALALALLLPAAAQTPAVAQTPAAAQTAAAHHYTVHVKDFAYSPSTLRIHTGDSVTFVNDDDEAHTATAADKSFDSAGLDTHDTWTHRFTRSGKFAYICTLHPWMKGVVIVSDPAKAAQ